MGGQVGHLEESTGEPEHLGAAARTSPPAVQPLDQGWAWTGSLIANWVLL